MIQYAKKAVIGKEGRILSFTDEHRWLVHLEPSNSEAGGRDHVLSILQSDLQVPKIDGVGSFFGWKEKLTNRFETELDLVKRQHNALTDQAFYED